MVGDGGKSSRAWAAGVSGGVMVVRWFSGVSLDGGVRWFLSAGTMRASHSGFWVGWVVSSAEGIEGSTAA